MEDNIDFLFSDAPCGKSIRTERRVKFDKEQLDWLDSMESKYDIAPSALVRMAVNMLMPKFSNHGASEESIARVYKDHYKTNK